MATGEQDFREALHVFIKGFLTILLLCVLKGIAGYLPETRIVRDLTLPALVQAALSVVALCLILRLYKPTGIIAAFYIEKLSERGTLPGGEAYLHHLKEVVNTIVLLVFCIAVYESALPVVAAVNDSLLRLGRLIQTINVVFAVFVIGILVLIWRKSQPLVDGVTGHIADNVARASTGKEIGVSCPSCKAENKKDAKFCVSCGRKMKDDQPTAVKSNKLVCQKCATVSMPYAHYCYNCGTGLNAKPAASAD